MEAVLYPFERFTERAKKVLTLAQEEAERSHHSYIGTEHLLLGLLREGEGLAAKVLNNLGVEINKVRSTIELVLGRNERIIIQQIIPTSRVKKVIEISFEEARRMGNNYVGTEHLLLGLLIEGEGIAAHVLEDLGANLEKVRGEIDKLLHELGIDEESKEAQKKPSKTPLLDQFCRDLTDLAIKNSLDPVIGRAMEIERVVQILSRRTKNNPALIGEPGVGKTAIAEGPRAADHPRQHPRVARWASACSRSTWARSSRAPSTAASSRSGFKKILDEIRASREVILFIDELHTLVGAGAAEGAIDAANILKPALARGEIQCIGATTLNEYRKYIEKDAALERRFQPVFVDEPTLAETIEILHGIRPLYEKHHRVKITDEALKAAAELSVRYVSDRSLPDKAIDLIDEASARVRMKLTTTPDELRAMQREIRELQTQKEEAIAAQDYETAANFRDKEKKLKDKYVSQETKWRDELGATVPDVTEEHIAEIISSWTGVPVSRLVEEETSRLLRMEEEIHKRLIGQDDAVKVISQAVRRARAGLKDAKRPIGSFMFLGPTGVGKTELSRALAAFLFDNEDAIIRLDMSEFMERHSTARLVGSPSGLRRLRRGRTAHRGGAPPSLLGRAVRRDREGAPRGLQHAVADPRGRPPQRRQGQGGQLRQHDHHHDQQPRRARAQAQHVAGLPAGGAGRADLVVGARQDARQHHGRAQEAVPSRVPQPRRRGGGLPAPRPSADAPDRGSAARQGGGAPRSPGADLHRLGRGEGEARRRRASTRSTERARCGA